MKVVSDADCTRAICKRCGEVYDYTELAAFKWCTIECWVKDTFPDQPPSNDNKGPK